MRARVCVSGNWNNTKARERRSLFQHNEGLLITVNRRRESCHGHLYLLLPQAAEDE